jgi:putative endonuclease
VTETTEPAGKVWYLYLLECLDGSIYTGIAVDVAARYLAHAKGTGARYTRAHPPRRILACQSFPDRSSASKAEYRVKQLSPAEKRHFAAQLAASAKNQIEVSAIDKVT